MTWPGDAAEWRAAARRAVDRYGLRTTPPEDWTDEQMVAATLIVILGDARPA